jgi:hypothetical protein
VFFFEPQGLWYLVYQDGAFGVAYATTTNIADPNSWSGPRSFGISGNLGWDYYVICDDASCFMYNSPSDGSRRIFIRRTALSSFPTGWSAPSVTLTDTFEGVNVYRSIADGQYYLVVEDLLDNRYYELWSSSSAGGPWARVAEKWAWRGNLVFTGSNWTNNVSHGDILRAGVNQRLEINDINRVDFLIQGTNQGSCCPYQQIPWDLGIIRNYTGAAVPGGDLLTNGSIESGTSGWSVFGTGSLSASTSPVHSGSRSLLITGRTAAWNGPGESVTSTLVNGKSYTTNVWVRTQTAAASQGDTAGGRQRNDVVYHPGAGHGGQLVGLDAPGGHDHGVLERDVVERLAVRRDRRGHDQLLYRRRVVPVAWTTACRAPRPARCWWHANPGRRPRPRRGHRRHHRAPSGGRVRLLGEPRRDHRGRDRRLPHIHLARRHCL